MKSCRRSLAAALFVVCGRNAELATATGEQEWDLIYEEDFTTPLRDSDARWEPEDYSDGPSDSVMDDGSVFYENDYGPDFAKALDSFRTYRKEFEIGKDGWLTASLSARDWNKDGTIEREPSLSIVKMEGSDKMALRMDASKDHTGGVILRNTRPLPDEYRIEYKLMALDFGGKRNGRIDYDGKINGYAPEGPVHPCKTQHPWGEGSASDGWSGFANASYCEWQDVVEDVYGYNGFSFMTIVDFPDPTPRNNHFWHYHRKVLIDSFSQHPDRVGSESGGRVCNPETNEYYDYRDSSFNVVNMWISGLPGSFVPKPGGLAGSRQRFMTTCNGGKATRGLQSAAELRPELMPYQYYTFAIERNASGYTLEVSGNFARAGFQTIRMHREFDVDQEPIWHYNADKSEYDGRYNADLEQSDWAFGSSVWKDQWPEGSAYPDSFVIGDPYTNVYEGVAALTDVRYYEPKQTNACRRTVLMTTGDTVGSGDRLISPATDLYLDQQPNANLQLWKGSPENPVMLLWESNVNAPVNTTYHTELQSDGSLVTYSRDPATSGKSIVWRTGAKEAIADQTCSLLVECDKEGGNLAIYAGPPQRSTERLWNAVTNTRSPTPRPTLSPVTNNAPDRDPGCDPVVLMKSGDFLYPGKRLVDYERNFHFIQLLNGNVEIRWGSPAHPGDLMWESGYVGSTDGAYYTKLEANGNLVTWRTDQNYSFSSVWETSTHRPALAVYYLVLDCMESGNKIAIYQGHPKHGGALIWDVDPASDAANQAPIPKPTVPPTSMPSFSPTSEAIDDDDVDSQTDGQTEEPSTFSTDGDSTVLPDETAPTVLPTEEKESAAFSHGSALRSWIAFSLFLFYIF